MGVYLSRGPVVLAIDAAQSGMKYCHKNNVACRFYQTSSYSNAMKWPPETETDTKVRCRNTTIARLRRNENDTMLKRPILSTVVVLDTRDLQSML